jgi:hypothetical protein
MTAPLVFDTLAFVKCLSAAGMDTQQAEALASALTEQTFEDLATKADLRAMAADLRLEMREMEIRFTNSLTSRMGVMIGGSTALTVAVLGALISVH